MVNAIFFSKTTLFIDNSTDVLTSFRVTEHSDRTGQNPEALLRPVTVVSCVSAELTNSCNTQNSLAVRGGAARRVGIVPPPFGFFRSVSEKQREKEKGRPVVI